MNWEEIKVKYVAKICNGKEIETEVEADDPNAIDVYGSGGVFKYTNKYLCDGEAVLFGRKGTVGKPLYANGKFWTVDTMFYVKCFDIDTKYLYYMFTMFPWDLYTKTTTLPSIVGSDIANSKITICRDVTEQNKISRFLDKKVTKIDAVINTIGKEIDVLEKAKRAIITETVMTGIDKSAKIVPFELDYVDCKPEDWEYTRIKYFCKLESGDNLVSNDIEEEGMYPVYGGNGLRGYYDSFTNDGEHVLIGRQGALCGNVHIVDGKFWATDHAVVTYSNEYMCNRFLYYLFTAVDFNKYSETAAQPGLAVKKIKNVHVCIPSTTAEQEEIADYLDEKCGAIDKILEVKKQQIEKLEMHKQSMIFDYVTGAKRVKGDN